MTATWTAAVIAVSFVQTAQAWHLYKTVNWLAAVQYTALPGLAALVMLGVLLMTGTSLWGFAVAGAAGGGTQLAGERWQAKREIKRRANQETS